MGTSTIIGQYHGYTIFMIEEKGFVTYQYARSEQYFESLEEIILDINEAETL